MTDADLAKAVCFVPDRLYYVSLRSVPRDRPNAHFFSIDDDLVYWNFFLDFGPLNLGQLYRFCQLLSSKLHDKVRHPPTAGWHNLCLSAEPSGVAAAACACPQAYADKQIYYYSGTHSHKRTNAAFLISAYAMLYLGRSPEEAFRPFNSVYPPFPPFHDASPCVCTYNLTIIDCLRGLFRARACKFFDFDRFDIDEVRLLLCLYHLCVRVCLCVCVRVCACVSVSLSVLRCIAASRLHSRSFVRLVVSVAVDVGCAAVLQRCSTSDTRRWSTAT
jgi:hypothetical protein